ncbi:MULTISPECIES: hypothetical protein [Chryseobacterium]|uniref:hypothetical protein n=1 Tax=Chryseobacterium TaxID=59732 RepID=UPI001296681E|nr:MULTISPECIES: hypothetical protein [Chryseobacterium]MDR6922278.1 hypothetical protein [Chryseobacterium sp. 2987]
MIQTEKLNSAILAIQDMIIRARSLAYKNESYEFLADFLDGIEYLPALILEKGDQTELFEHFLEELSTKYNFPEVFNKYKKYE